MNDTSPLAWLNEALADLQSRGLFRQRKCHTSQQGPLLEVDGRPLVNFASNDYLGLAADARLVQAAGDAGRTAGWGAGASPLIAGYHKLHRDLEQQLAEFEQVEAALVFSSGYAANVGTITALVGRGDAIFADALNHASLIDGCRLSRAEVHVYRHADCVQLAELVSASRSARKLIVTDSLFSMDGDLAPLKEIAAIAAEHGCMLMVDEAHATGVFGAHGRGACEAAGIEEAVHIRIGTLSKAIGSVGGFAAGSQQLIDWLVNRARPYVFSTASPPVMSAAAITALGIVATEPWRRVEALRKAELVRTQLASQGWNIGASRSQIIPMMAGSASRALIMADDLRQQGFWVPAIRPPSVPEGEARLRISLSYAHSEAMVDGLIEAMARLR